MKYRLNKIQLSNYKVFDNQVIQLNGGMNIFSGPNGYGKTSFFDAIEFLITGNMRRIKENDAIDGKKSYRTNFLARNPSKDVFIKGEFIAPGPSGEETFTIVKRVHQGRASKSNNPKSLKDITTTYILNSFDDPIEKGMAYEEHPANELSKLLGDNSQSRYQTIYYIEQEDRLNFFKFNEKARVDNLEFLFGIKDELDRAKEINDAISKLKKIVKTITNHCKMLSEQLSPEDAGSNTIVEDYFRLLSIEKKWDEKDIVINTTEERDAIIQELMSIRVFQENLTSFFADDKNQKISQLLESEEKLKSYIYKELINSNKEIYDAWITSFLFWSAQQKLITEQQYDKLDFQTLGNYIESSEEIALLKQITELEKTSSNAQNSLIELIRLRDELQVAYRKAITEELNACPYCGQPWESEKILDSMFENRKGELSSKMQSSGKELLLHKEKLKQRIEISYLPVIISHLDTAKENEIFTYYSENHKQIEKEAIPVTAQLKELGINCIVVSVDAERPIAKNVEALIEVLNKAQEKVSDTYYSSNEKFNFSQVFTSFYLNKEDTKNTTIKSINKKIEYIKYRFIANQQDKREKLTALKNLESFLTEKLDGQLSIYQKYYDESIAEYREQIIAAIEIPFFIFSSRVLQSYPEGRDIYRHGVILQTNKTSKLSVGIDSIRFVAPGKDHDILYTMSSGQLSGVLLSFTLALYKTFSDAKLNALFIDDPVQSMDELNIISFIELLKSEFSDVQLIVSTHEDSFSNFAHYKYLKARIPSQIIRLNEQILV